MDFTHYLIDRTARARNVFAHLQPFLSGKVLDFGAGDCNLISHIDSQPGLQGYGIDVRDYCQVPSFRNFRVYDGRLIPFPSDVFDTVISIYVIHHIRDQVSALSEIVRVLKPGGSMILLEDSFSGSIGEKVARFYDILTNLTSFQVAVELNFHSPPQWTKLIESSLPLRISEMRSLRLGPICKIVPASVYFKLLIVARKSATKDDCASVSVSPLGDHSTRGR